MLAPHREPPFSKRFSHRKVRKERKGNLKGSRNLCFALRFSLFRLC
jgi:hypothetical protein